MATPDAIFLPEKTTAERNAISPITDGMILYDTDSDLPFFYNGATTSWKPLVYDLQSAYTEGLHVIEMDSDGLTFDSTVAGNGFIAIEDVQGPFFEMYNKNVSPVADDSNSAIISYFNNSNVAKTEIGRLEFLVNDNTATNEDGGFVISVNGEDNVEPYILCNYQSSGSVDLFRKTSVAFDGDATGDASVMFEVVSTTAGSTPFPSMTDTEFGLIASPRNGLGCWNHLTDRIRINRGSSGVPSYEELAFLSDVQAGDTLQEVYDNSANGTINTSSGKHFMLDSQDAGFRPQQMGTIQFNNLSGKTAGLMAWNTTLGHYMYYDGSTDQIIPLDLQDAYNGGNGIIAMNTAATPVRFTTSQNLAVGLTSLTEANFDANNTLAGAIAMNSTTDRFRGIDASANKKDISWFDDVTLQNAYDNDTGEIAMNAISKPVKFSSTASNGVVFPVMSEVAFDSNNLAAGSFAFNSTTDKFRGTDLFLGAGKDLAWFDDVTLQNSYDNGGGSLSISGGNHLELSGTTAAFRLPQMTGAEFNALGSKSAGLLAWNTSTSRVVLYDGSGNMNIPLDLQDAYDLGNGEISTSAGKPLKLVAGTPSSAEFIVSDSDNPMITYEYTAQTFVAGESNGTFSFYALDDALLNIQTARIKSYINDFATTDVSGRLDFDARESTNNLQTYLRLNDNDNLRAEFFKRTNINNTGVSSTDNAAMFEVISTNRVSIPAPKMTTAQFVAIGSKTEGSQGWSTDDDRIQVYDGSNVKEVSWVDDEPLQTYYANISFRAAPSTGPNAFPTALNIPYSAAAAEGTWVKVTGFNANDIRSGFASFASDTITIDSSMPTGKYEISISTATEADVNSERIIMYACGINETDADKTLGTLSPVCVGGEVDSSQWLNISGSSIISLSANDTVKIFISQLNEGGNAYDDMNIGIIDVLIKRV